MVPHRHLFVISLGIVFLTGCGGRLERSPEPAYKVEMGPSDFVESVDNPYFPLRPGSMYLYETSTAEGLERINVEVLAQKRDVMGILATVVHDTVALNGELVEDTYDWFAQDKAGNVWYLGEDVSNYESGVFSDKAGSWEAGVDGALPGIIMYAEPSSHIGEPYRQEYYPDHAEDMAELLSVSASTTVPAGPFANVVKTVDYTPLEADLKEEKYYAPGIGLVRTMNLTTGEEEVLLDYSIP